MVVDNAIHGEQQSFATEIKSEYLWRFAFSRLPVFATSGWALSILPLRNPERWADKRLPNKYLVRHLKDCSWRPAMRIRAKKKGQIHLSPLFVMTQDLSAARYGLPCVLYVAGTSRLRTQKGCA